MTEPPASVTAMMHATWARLREADTALDHAIAIGNMEAIHAAREDQRLARESYHDAEMGFRGWTALEIGLLREDVMRIDTRLLDLEQAAKDAALAREVNGHE